ncbi:MAG: tyrosine-type recombinase/integrase [Bacteroidales bacterium]|nr:tyrosine-type recombinase/integrase [Bacteroidales bacterium]
MQTISQFIDYISIERRLSSLTVSAYTIDLNSFREFASQNQIENIEDVDSMLIRQWEMKLLEEENLSARSVCRKLAALRSWNKYLRKQNIVKQDFFVKVTAPKVQHQLPIFFRESEMENLKNTPTLFPETFEGIRDSLIIELFYETGIRRAELVGLCDNSFDFENNTVKVLGKRSKERIIPIEIELKQNILYYLDVRYNTIKCDSEKFFVSEKGKPITANKVGDIVKKYMSKVSNADRISPHILRHSFATHLLNNGADINAIKELLGHSSLAATQVYTHNTIEKLKKIYKSAHPRA